MNEAKNFLQNFLHLPDDNVQFIAQENILLNLSKKGFIESLSGYASYQLEEYLDSESATGTITGVNYRPPYLKSVKEPYLGPIADCREEPMSLTTLVELARVSNSKLEFLKNLN